MNSSRIILELILQAIGLRGMTENQVIVACGLSSSFFSEWKSGRIKSPSFNKVSEICRLLGVSMDTFEIIPEDSSDKKQCDLACSPDEIRILEKYRALDDDGKDAVRGVIIAEQRRVEVAKEEAKKTG